MHPIVYNACLAVGIACTSIAAGLVAGAPGALAAAGLLTLVCTFATAVIARSA